MINWYIKRFDDLSPRELYAILRLRAEVFVVEQNCVFQDMDNKDQPSFHVMGWHISDPDTAQPDPVLLACSRLVPPGISYEYPSIGRVASSPHSRGMGLGKILMEKSIAELGKLYGITPVRIGAQLYLRAFYESFGFLQTSDVYDEDGIPHIEMTRW